METFISIIKLYDQIWQNYFFKVLEWIEIKATTEQLWNGFFLEFDSKSF